MIPHAIARQAQNRNLKGEIRETLETLDRMIHVGWHQRA